MSLLQNLASAYGWDVCGQYLDDGCTGTIPLSERPEGARLLQDARRGAFDVVVAYRLDRVGRSLKTLLDAHEQLSACNVTLRSATEPFDTSTSIGKFLFQLLGSLAELDRSTVLERMRMGRDRVARGGVWFGAVPFGYMVDGARHLVPSDRLVAAADLTEAEIAHTLYARVAEGTSAVQMAVWLNSLDVPTERRYASGRVARLSERWTADRVTRMLHSPIYVGRRVLKSKGGAVEHDVPPLVDEVTWAQVQAQLTANRLNATRNGHHVYLLRGLIVCTNCGRRYAGRTATLGPNAGRRDYACRGTLTVASASPDGRCHGKMLPADPLEAAVWERCRAYIRHPDAALEDARRELAEQAAQLPAFEAEARRLGDLVAAKEAERDRVLTLYRRGTIGQDVTETQLAEIRAEADGLDQLRQAVAARALAVRAEEAQFASARTFLLSLRGDLDEIERTGSPALKRQIVETLVAQIDVDTRGAGHKKEATVRPRFLFSRRERPIELRSATASQDRRYVGTSVALQVKQKRRIVELAST